MTSELDLDDAIASILADTDEDTGSRKKQTSSKRKGSKLLSSKALTSSVNDEEFYKNLSKISEEQTEGNPKDNVELTEEDTKKMTSSLAGLDDLDSDLIGSLGRKNKVTSPRNKPGKDHDQYEKHPHDTKRKSSSGSLHRKGSVTPFSGEDEIGVLDNNLMLSDDEENDDVLSSSMNSSTSKHRKVSPNKISPRVSMEDMPEEDGRLKKSEAKKMSKSKEIDFDSDDDLPGLDNKETEVSAKVTRKPSSKSRKPKKRDDGDLFGDDDDLPDLDSSTKSGSSKTKAASALDSLMGKKTKSSTDQAKKTKPSSLDEFMAKVSTTNKTSPNSEIQSPVRSSTSEETFQFGGYMPSAGSRRRSKGHTGQDSTSEFGRRSVKFSDDLGLDDDLFSPTKRPSTAPVTRRKKEEPKDPLNNTFSASSVKDDSLGLNKKKENKATTVKEDVSPQSSLQGSKSSTSGDWLGLGDDVTDDQLNTSLTTHVRNDQDVMIPEAVSTTTTLTRSADKKQDDELSNDMVLSLNRNKTEMDDDKSFFPWESGKSSARRPRPETVSSGEQQDFSDVLHKEIKVRTRTGQLSSPAQNQAQGKDFKPDERTLAGNQQTSRVLKPVLLGGTSLAQSSSQVHHGLDSSRVTSPEAGFHEQQYRSELHKQHYEVELKEMAGKIHDVENEKYKVEIEMANKVVEMETKIRRLEVENDTLKQSLELRKQRSKEDIEAIENSHRNRVQTLEESYQRREARQREEIDILTTKHKETVALLEREKSDFQTTHVREISALESNKLSEIERLNDVHRRALDEVRREHLAEINHLKKMKDQEISATVTAFSHTKSLQSLMEQVLNSTKQVEDLHHLVEVSHKSSQQERDITMKSKDEYLNQLQNRLLKQQTENGEERSRLQNLVAKLEIQIREQNRKFEENKWKLDQEDSRLKSLRVSLEEERRVTREQLEAERGLVQRTKEEFLNQQRQIMMDINEERKTLALERAELSAAQRGMMNKEKQKHDSFTKLDAEQESARVRLAEDTAALNAREARLNREQEELRREKRIFKDKQDHWNTEKEHIGKLGLELERRAHEIDELSLQAAKVREEGRNSLEVAQRMQVEISQQANELEAKVLALQEKERQIADERLVALKERKELEMERRRNVCSRCSQSQAFPLENNSNQKRQPVTLSQSSQSTLSAHYVTPRELVTSPPGTRTSSAHSLPPDLLVNTLDLKRTLRRWSLDKEQDEEFLAKESEFLNSLQDSCSSPLYDF